MGDDNTWRTESQRLARWCREGRSAGPTLFQGPVLTWQAGQMGEGLIVALMAEMQRDAMEIDITRRTRAGCSRSRSLTALVFSI